MGVGALAVEITATFCLAAAILYRYGNWYRHHVVVTLAVLIAWYFSLIIVFVLPLDVSNTAYQQCLRSQPDATDNTTSASVQNLSEPSVAAGDQRDQASRAVCKEPWSHVPPGILPDLWRVVYWTSQCLTWLILPLMQSYTQAGDFTVGGKLRSSLIDNAIYYGSYLLICGILLVYIALRPDLDLDGPKLKIIASTASNTWGLFLLVLLLGYGLVEVPRSLWHCSHQGYSLRHAYFKMAKLDVEKSEAEENLDDVLESVHLSSEALTTLHPYRPYIDTILMKVPTELQERMRRQHRTSNSDGLDIPSEKSLIRLHRQVIKALQTHHRTETQWNVLVEKTLELEDVARNENSNERAFRPSFSRPPSCIHSIYTPRIEWYWRCLLWPYVLRVLAVVLAILSLLVVWSEVTFFNKSPVLSLFAVFVNLAKASYDYIAIEIVSCAVVSYLCVCSYYTIFRVRVLNYYYLSPYHQTDEYSLIFSGMLLCRLTPPMCLNFLGLIHMDSHIIKDHIEETYYTQIMGHMDVISIISDGFNIYFPMAILVLCLLTYFSVGSRVLSFMGFQQFVGEDDITTDLVDEGRELLKREKRRRQRVEETQTRRKDFQERFGTSGAYRTSRQRASDKFHSIQRDDSGESSQVELLQDNEPPGYGGSSSMLFQPDRSLEEPDSIELFPRNSRNRTIPPPKGIFDDV